MSDMPSLSALYLQDPKLAAALRARLYAEQLQKAGGDTSPVQSPWQGVSRVVQGLLGGYEEQKADSDLKAQGDAQQAEAAARSAQYDQIGMGGGYPGALAPNGAQPTPMSNALAGQPPGFGGVLKNESGGSMAPNIWGDGGRSAGPAQVQQAALDDVNKLRGTSYTLADLAKQPGLGVQVGKDYYGILLNRYGGDVAKAQAAYNAGMGRVDTAAAANGDNWRAGIPASTQGYLDRAGQDNAPNSPQTQQPDYQSMIAAGYQKMAQARQMADMASADANSLNPAVRRGAEMRMRQAQMLHTEGQQMVTQASGKEQPLSPELEAQKIRIATANSTKVVQDVKNWGEGASEAYKLAAQDWKSARDAVQQNKLTEQDLTQFETFAKAFQTGSLANERKTLERVYATLGLPNNAAAADAMERIQTKLSLGIASTSKLAPMSDTDLRLIQTASNLITLQPEALPVVLEATRAAHRYQENMLKVYNESARRNGGTPNPLDIAEAVQNMAPPISDALREKMAAIVNRAEAMRAPPSPAGAQAAPAPNAGPKEGDTATNPQTGQRIIFSNGQWMPMQGGR